MRNVLCVVWLRERLVPRKEKKSLMKKRKLKFTWGCVPWFPFIVNWILANQNGSTENWNEIFGTKDLFTASVNINLLHDNSGRDAGQITFRYCPCVPLTETNSNKRSNNGNTKFALERDHEIFLRSECEFNWDAINGVVYEFRVQTSRGCAANIFFR